MERKIEDYLDLPYHFIITRDEDDDFDIAVAELAGCITYAQAWEDIPLVVREAMTSWIGSALKHGDKVPEPSPIINSFHSNKAGSIRTKMESPSTVT